MAIAVLDGKFLQRVRSDATETQATSETHELKWTSFDSELLQEAVPSDARISLGLAPMSEWTAELDAESMAIHVDLSEASFRALPDD